MTPTGSRPTGIEGPGTSPPSGVTVNTSSRASGVFTTRRLFPEGVRAIGWTWEDSKFTYWACAGPRSPPARGQSYPTIATIRIDREDVFDLDNPDERHLPFIWADRLHVETREYVIRRELLFQEGDPADPDVLYESERNLRRLVFLHDN